MAQDTVDKAIDVCKLQAKGPCVTPGLFLEGGHEYNDLLYIRLVQDYGLEVDVIIILLSLNIYRLVCVGTIGCYPFG